MLSAKISSPIIFLFAFFGEILKKIFVTNKIQNEIYSLLNCFVFQD